MNAKTSGLIALIAGALLAVMIFFNSGLGARTSTTVASFYAHGVGAVVALGVWFGLGRLSGRSERSPAPWWAYLGGVPGALVVVVAAITVNSPLGLTGTLVLGVSGQTAFGLLCDQRGWLGLPRRPLDRRRAVSVAAMLLGAVLLVGGAA